jgi:Domain of unknown function (DUF4179)
MDEQLKDIKARYESVYDKETSNRIKEGVFNRLEENSKHTFFNKKISYLAGAAIIVIGLFLGSGLVSPTMAKVLSQIPYIDQIYKSMNDTEERKKDVQGFYHDLYNELVKEDTGIIDVSMKQKFPSDPPFMLVLVDDKRVKDQHEKEVRNTVEKYAQKHDIIKYNLEVKVGKLNRVPISKKEKERMEMEEEFFNIALEKLKQNGYESEGISISRDKKIFTITIAESKDKFEKIKNNLEDNIQRALDEESDLQYKVVVDRVPQIKKTESDWYPIFDSIMNETNKNFTEVRGFAYSFHPQPLQIIIKTSLRKGKEGKDQAAVIEEYAHKVTEIKRKEMGLEKIPYIIIIRDQKHDKLYCKTYK